MQRFNAEISDKDFSYALSKAEGGRAELKRKINALPVAYKEPRGKLNVVPQPICDVGPRPE